MDMLQDGGADETCISSLSSTQISVEEIDGKNKKAIGKFFQPNMAGQPIIA